MPGDIIVRQDLVSKLACHTLLYLSAFFTGLFYQKYFTSDQVFSIFKTVSINPHYEKSTAAINSMAYWTSTITAPYNDHSHTNNAVQKALIPRDSVEIDWRALSYCLLSVFSAGVLVMYYISYVAAESDVTATKHDQMHQIAPGEASPATPILETMLVAFKDELLQALNEERDAKQLDVSQDLEERLNRLFERLFKALDEKFNILVQQNHLSQIAKKRLNHPVKHLKVATISSTTRFRGKMRLSTLGYQRISRIPVRVRGAFGKVQENDLNSQETQDKT